MQRKAGTLYLISDDGGYYFYHRLFGWKRAISSVRYLAMRQESSDLELKLLGKNVRLK